MSDYETALLAVAAQPWLTGLVAFVAGATVGWIARCRAIAADRAADRQAAQAERAEQRAIDRLRHIEVMAEAERAIDRAKQTLYAIGRASVPAVEPAPEPPTGVIAGSDLPPRGDGLPDWLGAPEHPDTATIIAQTLADLTPAPVEQEQQPQDRSTSGPPVAGYRYPWPQQPAQPPATPVRGVMPRRWLVRLRKRAAAPAALLAAILGLAVDRVRTTIGRAAAVLGRLLAAARRRLADRRQRRRERMERPLDDAHQWVRGLTAYMRQPRTKAERLRDLAGAYTYDGRHRAAPLRRRLAGDWQARRDRAVRELMPTVGGRL